MAPAATPNERAHAISRALALLRAGEVVALPTETVYGLAADALSLEAVAKIFETKERPRFDPLIVHLPDFSWLPRVATTSALVEKLTENFWPGPLTILLPKTSLIPEIVTAGLTTVAVRMSAHPIFSEIVRDLDRPLAAPSANRFGRISPTMAEHVFEELAGRIPLIVDGGATEHGVESTIVRPEKNGMIIMRAGPITREQLAEFGEIHRVAGNALRPEAPGQLPSHYAPRTPLLLADDVAQITVPNEKRYGALLWSSEDAPRDFVAKRRLSATRNLREAAANLFRVLRELDGAGLDLIVAEAVPEIGLGMAIMDRLRRAAHR
ncbi:MAG: threonylcarbamoyl-AMP synthase [Chthoniobacterales bacterium]|nr:threonylcarbamoyl-AMP synthase [Chthoniobacterales bacterium]